MLSSIGKQYRESVLKKSICAEHLSVESYTVIISQQSYLLFWVFRHPLTLSFQA